MLSKKILDKYLKKLNNEETLTKKELENVVNSFDYKVSVQTETMYLNKIKEKPFDEFFNMKEYDILLKCADSLDQDITDIYLPKLDICKYTIDVKDENKKYICSK